MEIEVKMQTIMRQRRNCVLWINDSFISVSFGSTVKVANIETEEEEVYTICGVLESEPENGLISIHSPLAVAMIGKEVDDEFKVKLPKLTKEYEILNIEYKNIFSLKKIIRTKKEFAFH